MVGSRALQAILTPGARVNGPRKIASLIVVRLHKSRALGLHSRDK